MSPLRRRKNRTVEPLALSDDLGAFLAQPAQIGTSDADVAAVAQADAERAANELRMAAYVETEEALDRNAPRPPVLDTLD